MEKRIKSRMDNKEYDNITDPIKFAEELTADLQSVSKDKHIQVRFDP
ncbi:MAG: hypothetical protein IPN57_07875, partial [Ignavibacteria bacterium]|nr:hypothetical protein [Ignavibacteria bacterium]